MKAIFRKIKGKSSIKNIKILCLLLICVGMILIDYQCVQKINQAGTQTYFVQEKNRTYETIESNQESTFVFKTMGENMVAVGLDMLVPEDGKGEIHYVIKDENGELTSWQTMQVDTLSVEDGFLWFKLQSFGLEQGKEYTVTYVIEGISGICVCMSDGEPIIIQQFTFTHQNLMYLIILAVNVIVLLLCMMFFKHGLSNKMFVLASLVIGVLFAVLVPPMSSADEYRHFLRAYDLATQGQYSKDFEEIDDTVIGNVMRDAADNKYPLIEVPSDFNELRLMSYIGNTNEVGYAGELNDSFCVDKMINLLNTPEDDSRVWVSELATSNRSLICYWNQVLFIMAGLLFGVRSIYLYYLAKIGQVVVCTLIGWICLRLCPKQKNMVWLLAFVPSVMTITASCNSDSLLIFETLLAICILLFMREHKIKLLSVYGMIGMAVFLLFVYSILKMKVPYAITCVLALLFLSRDNISRVANAMKNRKKQSMIGGIIAVVFVLIFVYLGREQVFSIVNQFVSKEHCAYIKENLNTVAILFVSKWKEQVHQLYDSMDGAFFIPYAFVIFVVVILSKKELPIWKQIYGVIVFSCLVMMIVLAGFTLTPPEYAASNGIWGITYRYYLPFLPVIFVALPCGTEKTQKCVEAVYPMFVFAMISMYLVQITTGYWVR